jgi:hypothetical protein
VAHAYNPKSSGQLFEASLGNEVCKTSFLFYIFSDLFSYFTNCNFLSLLMFLFLLYVAAFQKIRNSQVLVICACNPSYSGGRDQEDSGSKTAHANRS